MTLLDGRVAGWLLLEAFTRVTGECSRFCCGGLKGRGSFVSRLTLEDSHSLFVTSLRVVRSRRVGENL